MRCCSVCGVLVPMGQTRCADHRRPVYGAGHNRARRAVAAVVASGRVRCGRGADCFWAENGLGGFILPGQKWDLGHMDGDPNRYAGPEHRRCNRATAGR